MQNIEFKAELRDLAAARAQCASLGAQHLGVLRQTDTYFRMADGRLKRREAPGEPIEWIFYHRLDGVAPRPSSYSILSDEQARRRWGTHSLREWIVVHKTRDLWMWKNVRIHLDEVDTLGTFIEFEAMVSDVCGPEDCGDAVVFLRDRFTPVLGEPIGVSYVDLIAAEAETEF